MPILKLRAVDERPCQVHRGWPPIALGGLEIRRHHLQFRVGGIARENRQVDTVDGIARPAAGLGLQQGAEREDRLKAIDGRMYRLEHAPKAA